MKVEVNIPLSEKEFTLLAQGKTVQQTVTSYVSGVPEVVVNIGIKDIGLKNVLKAIIEAERKRLGKSDG